MIEAAWVTGKRSFGSGLIISVIRFEGFRFEDLDRRDFARCSIPYCRMITNDALGVSYFRKCFFDGERFVHRLAHFISSRGVRVFLQAFEQ